MPKSIKSKGGEKYVEVEQWFDEKGELTKYLANGIGLKIPLPIQQVNAITTHRLITIQEARKHYNYPK